MRISDWSSDVCSSDLGSCQRTDPSRAPDADEARNAWLLAPAPWPALAKNLAAAPQPTLQAVWSGLCGPSRCRSEEHTSELQSLMRISYAVFCLSKKTQR